jgi:hypothetical protein
MRCPSELEHRALFGRTASRLKIRLRTESLLSKAGRGSAISTLPPIDIPVVFARYSAFVTLVHPSQRGYRAATAED